jgi:hypothetical protein
MCQFNGIGNAEILLRARQAGPARCSVSFESARAGARDFIRLAIQQCETAPDINTFLLGRGLKRFEAV